MPLSVDENAAEGAPDLDSQQNLGQGQNLEVQKVQLQGQVESVQPVDMNNVENVQVENQGEQQNIADNQAQGQIIDQGQVVENQGQGQGLSDGENKGE